jgi:hypothetical protein
MVASIRNALNRISSTWELFFDWLTLANEFEKLQKSEAETSSVPSAKQPGTSITLPAKLSGTRIINYWSESGEFFQWRYTAATMQATHQHIAFLADDPLIDFTWSDVARVHEMMRFMELTMDCQDVVGW